MKFFSILIGFTIPIGLLAQSNLTITTGAKMNVTGNWVLTVEGPITNQGEMTITDGSSLIQTHTGYDANSNTGDYLVKRVGANSDTKYNIWSSPIMAADIYSTFSANPCYSWTFKGSEQLWKYDFAIGVAPGTCAGNTVSFVANDLVAPDAVADGIMNATRGYFIPGDAVTSERIFTGDVNNGDLTTTIWATNITTSQWSGSNWNLVGNPYPSSIDLATFWSVNTTSGAISNGIYFWNDSGTGTYNQCSDYVVWNPIGTVGSCGASFSSNGLVSSGQGFWVYAGAITPSTATVTFNNSMRTSAANTNFYKAAPTFERVWLSVKRNNRYTNQILLGLKDDASIGYDPMYDARKLPESSTMELAFVQDSGIYVIIAQPTVSYNEQEELPLYLNTDSAGIHEFAFDSLQNVTGGNKYYLIDKKLNVTHDLSSPYQVQLAAGEYQNRFYLLYTDVVNGVDEGATNNLFVKVFQTENEIQIQSNKIDLKTVTVYSAVGANLWHKSKIKSPNLTIPVQQLAAGVYFVNYELTNGTTETKKIIITN